MAGDDQCCMLMSCRRNPTSSMKSSKKNAQLVLPSPGSVNSFAQSAIDLRRTYRTLLQKPKALVHILNCR